MSNNKHLSLSDFKAKEAFSKAHVNIMSIMKANPSGSIAATVTKNFNKGLITEDLFTKAMEQYETMQKGTEFEDGEVREWNGKSYLRVDGEWGVLENGEEVK